MCDKIFSQKGNLLNHISTIHEGKRYNCDMCDKEYMEKSSLLDHISSIHEGNKSVCNMCDKAFAKKYLSRHKCKIQDKGMKYADNKYDKIVMGQQAQLIQKNNVKKLQKKCKKIFYDGIPKPGKWIVKLKTLST